MDSEARRLAIYETLKATSNPIKGSELAKQYGRQSSSHRTRYCIITC